jgi:hypothetical protein
MVSMTVEDTMTEIGEAMIRRIDMMTAETLAIIKERYHLLRVIFKNCSGMLYYR